VESRRRVTRAGATETPTTNTAGRQVSPTNQGRPGNRPRAHTNRRAGTATPRSRDAASFGAGTRTASKHLRNGARTKHVGLWARARARSTAAGDEVALPDWRVSPEVDLAQILPPAPLIPRETRRWRDLYRGRAAVEREFGTLTQVWRCLLRNGLNTRAKSSRSSQANAAPYAPPAASGARAARRGAAAGSRSASVRVHGLRRELAD